MGLQDLDASDLIIGAAMLVTVITVLLMIELLERRHTKALGPRQITLRGRRSRR